MTEMYKGKGKKHIAALIASIAIAEGTGALSAFLGMTKGVSYENLTKPSFSPPAWVFPVVWIILYFLMAVAAYRIWMYGREGKGTRRSLKLYDIQLILNFLWTIIFFRLGLFGAAFIELLILLVLILLTTFEFYKEDKISAYLMIPYIAWTAFAGVLNCAIWMLNK